jgi:hypothetical protein
MCARSLRAGIDSPRRGRLLTVRWARGVRFLPRRLSPRPPGE